jgi:predicted transcriptional regulator of viral defense system
MGVNADGLVSEVAQRHHGVFASRHLRDLGITAHVRKHRLATGRWEAVHEGVYRLVALPLSWHGRVLAACWAGGTDARASHSSAAELWELPRRSTEVIEITCRRWRRTQQRGLVVHETRALSELDAAERHGIPVTTAARTIFDLAATSGPRTLDLMIESALRRRLTTYSELHRTLERLARRGRRGTTKFRAALDRRGEDDVLTESEAELLLMRLLTDHGLPAPVPQHQIRDRDGRVVARVDLAYPDLRIAIEYDSYAHHVGNDALVRDSARRNAVVALGWLPITATANDLRNGGHRLATDVRQARALRTGVNSAE